MSPAYVFLSIVVAVRCQSLHIFHSNCNIFRVVIGVVPVVSDYYSKNSPFQWCGCQTKLQNQFQNFNRKCFWFSLCRLIAADRPYWWIYQGGPYATQVRPPLEQKPLTCETTPGIPSAEIALLFSMLYLIASGQVGRTLDHFSIAPSSSFVRSQLCYGSVSFALFAVVAVTQLFYATHFLHQCYFGIIFGVTTSHLIIRNDGLRLVTAASKRNAMYLFLLVVIASLAFYTLTYIVVGDPRWSTHRVSPHTDSTVARFYRPTFKSWQSRIGFYIRRPSIGAWIRMPCGPTAPAHTRLSTI